MSVKNESTLVILAFVVLLAIHVGGLIAHSITGKTLLEALAGVDVSKPMSKLQRAYVITGFFAFVTFETGLVLWLTPRVKWMRKFGPFVWAIVIALLLCNCYIVPRTIYIDVVSKDIAKKIGSDAASKIASAVGAEKLKKVQVAMVSDKAMTLSSWLLTVGVPLSIALLLARIDLRAIARTIGWRPFLLFFAGSMGTVLGGYVIVFLLSSVPGFCPDTIKVIACKVAAWIGGSENDGAILGMLHPSGDWYSYHRIAGSVAYALYVAFIFGLAGTPLAEKINRFIKPVYNAEEIAKMYRASAAGVEEKGAVKVKERELLLVSAYALIILTVSLMIEVWAGPKGIYVAGVPIPTVLLATTFAIAAATFISVVKKMPLTHEIGMYLLYVIVVTYIAVKTDLAKLVGQIHWVFILFGAYMLLLAIHLGVILLAAKILRVDWTTTAVASVANIGGAVTAPLCATTYRVPELVPIAVVMASLGYALANYLAYFLFAVPLNGIFPGVIPAE